MGYTSDINSGIAKLLNGEFTETWPRSQEIVQFGYYSQSLKVYYELFDKANILVLFQEDILKDKHQQIRKAYDFLKIDNSHESKFIDSKPKKAIYSILRLKVLTRRNKYLFSYYHNNTRLVNNKNLGRLDKILIKLLSGIDTYILSKVFSNKKPSLSQENRSILINLYENDICLTEQFLNVDLSAWKQ